MSVLERSPIPVPLPPRRKSLDIVIIGLAITSSWGNGHATTYRGLVRELARREHDVLFLEHDQPWYASNRDLPHPPYGMTYVYRDTNELFDRFADRIEAADLVIVGSYVCGGIDVGEFVTSHATGLTAFYDIDTPVTLAKLAAGECYYLSPKLIRRYGMYLSFTGGPTLSRLESEFGSPRALPLYCSVDPEIYRAEARPLRWDLGYLGTYSADRQPPLNRLMIDAARASSLNAFVVAGSQYPDNIDWPPNLQRIDHLAPGEHCRFYNQQRFTLNITRADMVRAGYSPSVRLFEAAACGIPVISDNWPGLETFFEPGREILLARDADDTLRYLRDTSEIDRRRIGSNAQARVLSEHTASHRAAELEKYALQGLARLRA